MTTPLDSAPAFALLRATSGPDFIAVGDYRTAKAEAYQAAADALAAVAAHDGPIWGDREQVRRSAAYAAERAAWIRRKIRDFPSTR